MCNKKQPTKQMQNAAMQQYPGAAIDAADKNHVDAEMVDADVKELNNNPRNNDLDQ